MSDAEQNEHDEHEGTTKTERPHDGLPTFLAIFYRVCRYVFLALALILVLAIVLILAPANEDNSIVSGIMDLGEQVAGPFKDIFTVDDAEREKIVNYGLAAVVYFVAASLITKLPTGKKGV